jgi:hypothetical protein
MFWRGMNATVKLERVSLEQPAENVRGRVPRSSVRRVGRCAAFGTVRGHISVFSLFEYVAGEPVSWLKPRFGRGGDVLKKPSPTLTYSHLLSSTLISDGGTSHYFRGKVGRAQKPYSPLPFSQGVSIARWARANEVPARMAFRWARGPMVREGDNERMKAEG